MKADRTRRLIESIDSLLDKNDEWKLKNNKGLETVTRYDLEEMFQEASHFNSVEAGDQFFSYDKEYPYSGPEGASEAWRRLRKNFKAKEGGQEGYLYKVDLDIKEDEFLDFNDSVPKRLFKMLGDSWIGNKPIPRASDMVIRESEFEAQTWDIVEQKTNRLFSAGLSEKGAKAELADLTQAKVDDVYKTLINQDLEMMPGERFYHMLSDHLANQAREDVTPAQVARMSDREISQALANRPSGAYLASMALAKEGIYGIRYPGAMAPGNRDYKNSNYVIFDDSKIRIEEKNGNRVDLSEINEANFMPSDQDYLAAVDKGDTGAAQAMVDQAAKKAGHKGPYFHGSPNTGKFNQFAPGRGGAMFFSENKSYSEDFGKVGSYYLKSNKVFDFVNNPEHRQKAINLFNELGGWKTRVEDGDIEPRDYRYDPKLDDDWEIFDNPDTGLLDRLSDQEGYDEFIFREDTDTIAHAVFDPSQIKSAEPVTRDDDGNVIPLSERFNPEEDDFRYMPATDDLGFYSRVEEVVESSKIPNKGEGKQILNTIKGQPGVKDDEIKWLGLDEFLEGKEKVTKEELTDFIRENDLQMEEVILGDNDITLPISRRVHQGYWREFILGGNDVTLPPGKMTFEEMLASPDYTQFIVDYFDGESTPALEKEIYQKYLDDEAVEVPQGGVARLNLQHQSEDSSPTLFESQVIDGAEPGTYREVLLKIKPKQKKITELPEGWTIESHRDARNLSHYRLKVPYTDWNYERSLEGSTKEEAFKSAVRVAQEKGLLPKDKSFRSTHWEEPNVIAHLRFNERKGPNGERILFLEELQSDWHLQGRKKGYGGRVPDAPFKGSWHELALKRMLRFAAEGNYDKLAWIDGEETAKRYDLSQRVDSVEVSESGGTYDIKVKEPDDSGYHTVARDVKKGDVEKYIGKELAKKAIDKAWTDGVARLEGVDLEIGGEWAYNLYDRMVPQFLKRYGKKWGSRLSDVEFLADGDKYEGQIVFSKYQSVNITPEMKESVEAGQPRFMPATDPRIPSKVPAKPVVSNRSPMLQWLAQSFIERGTIDKEEWTTAVNALSPIDAQRSQFPDAYKIDQVNKNYQMVLDSTKREKFVDVLLGEGPEEGTDVGLRIDINAFENSLKKVASGELDFPIYIVTIHSKGGKNIGKDILGYSAIGAVSNPTFLIGSEKGSFGIAAGRRKTTLATVEGKWVPLTEVPNVTGKGWTRAGMDPTRHSYFYDKATGEPIKGGSLAVSFGNTVFVRDAIPMTREEVTSVLYMPTKEVGDSKVYTGDEGSRIIKTKSGKFRVYGPNKQLMGVASSEKTAERILRSGTKKVSVRKRPSRGLVGTGGS